MESRTGIHNKETEINKTTALIYWLSNTPSDHDLTVSYPGDEHPSLLEVPLQLPYVNQLVTPPARDFTSGEVQLRGLAPVKIHLRPIIIHILRTRQYVPARA